MLRSTILLTTLALLSVPAAAQDGLVVDYSEPGMLDLANPAQWGPIAERIGGGVVALGEAGGAFTEAGSEQIAYLVSSGPTIAAEPFPDLDQRIVVYEDDEQVADWTLPEGSAFARPVAAHDLDGDGIDELLLETNSYNMGTSVMGVSSVALGKKPKVLQVMPEVYIDSCDAPMGEKNITVGRVTAADGELKLETDTQPCP